MPLLRNTLTTSSTDTPAYQSSISSECVRRVERGVHQEVGVGVLRTRHVREVDDLVALEEVAGLLEQRPKMRLLDAPAALDLTDYQHRIGADAQDARREPPCRLEPRDQGPIFGNVVRRVADALAHGREPRRRVGTRVLDDRADRGRAGIPAGAAVAVHDDLLPQPLGHGTRMQPQLSQCVTGPPAPCLIRSTSVAGIVKWQPWQVFPTRRAAPTPFALARVRS